MAPIGGGNQGDWAAGEPAGNKGTPYNPRATVIPRLRKYRILSRLFRTFRGIPVALESADPSKSKPFSFGPRAYGISLGGGMLVLGVIDPHPQDVDNDTPHFTPRWTGAAVTSPFGLTGYLQDLGLGGGLGIFPDRDQISVSMSSFRTPKVSPRATAHIYPSPWFGVGLWSRTTLFWPGPNVGPGPLWVNGRFEIPPPWSFFPGLSTAQGPTDLYGGVFSGFKW